MKEFTGIHHTDMHAVLDVPYRVIFHLIEYIVSFMLLVHTLPPVHTHLCTHSSSATTATARQLQNNIVLAFIFVSIVWMVALTLAAAVVAGAIVANARLLLFVPVMLLRLPLLFLLVVWSCCCCFWTGCSDTLSHVSRISKSAEKVQSLSILLGMFLKFLILEVRDTSIFPFSLVSQLASKNPTIDTCMLLATCNGITAISVIAQIIKESTQLSLVCFLT